jgi:hypothetical protein
MLGSRPVHPRRFHRRLFHLALGLLAALHVWLAISVSDRIGVSSDEIAHLAAGHGYWTQNDFRLQPENGLLPQRLAALPNVLADGLRFPDLENNAKLSEKWRKGDVWGIGAAYFYESGNDLPALLRRGRWSIALLGGLGVLLIGLWARSLGGETGGALAAGLASLSPTLLAHAGLATSDTAAAVGFVAAILCWWRLLHRLSPGRLALAGVSAGLLALAKFSGVIFAPIAAALLLLALCARRSLVVAGWPRLVARRLRGARRAGILFAASAAAASIALLTIWAGYGFRYSAAGPRAPADSGFDQTWASVLPTHSYEGAYELADGTAVVNGTIRPRTLHSVIRFARDHRLLPEAWLYGLAFVDKNAQSRPAYFAGEWRFTGWPAFFPLAALLKSTPGEFVLVFLVAAGWFALLRAPLLPGRRLAYRAAPLVVAISILWAFSITSHLNIGHRHLLPVYALGFVMTGLLPRLLARRLGPRARTAAMCLLLAGQAYAALSIRPHYLTYFNALAGGPANGHRFLVDSSLDWGQGLPELKRWLESAAPPHERVFISYFGSDRPERLGLDVRRFGDNYFRIGQESFFIHPLEPGLYVISATMWRRVYTHVRGPWSVSFETAYWRHFDFWRSEPPPLWDGLNRHELPVELGTTRLMHYDHLRLGKLIHGLRSREPLALVANQFFVFQLTREDLDEIMARPSTGLPPPSP